MACYIYAMEAYPYPKQYEERITLEGGQSVLFRPIQPADGPLILDIFSKLSPESIFYRFLTHLEHLQPEQLEHLVQIDYVTHFALAAVIMEDAHEAIIGTSRYIVTGQPDRAELTVTIRDDWQGKKLGKMLVSRVVDIARSRGIATIEILLDSRNEAMKRLFSHLGYPARYESYVLDVADHMEIDITREKNLMAPYEEVLNEFRL
jgi:acetyltransferase